MSLRSHHAQRVADKLNFETDNTINKNQGTMDKRFRITLLFNANKVYDREVIEGIGEYLQASQCDWDIFLEEEFTTHLDNFHNWKGDGVIADFDNPKIAELLKDSDIPVVGVGGSYEKDEDYPDILMLLPITKHSLNWHTNIYGKKG
ncbi:xylose activator XylR AraC family [Vibrio variabilis]|uniref:Xylose activator XylR AraC family n=1 Tax=Vibrio variabilis TaxID=990271 RepID=A0ABQ0JHT1_9VIBR|nr:xylose activator XylR AraC family [Vibrio variabilis]